MTGINTPNALLVLAAAVYLHGCMTSPARSEPADQWGAAQQEQHA